MDAKNIQIPSTIKDATTLRFIRYLLTVIIELDDRVKKLEANS
jgi:hypothetical protein